MGAMTRTFTRPIRLRAMGLCAGLVAILPAFTRADVLEQMPSDAPLVGRVKNLQELSGKVAVLAKKWGLDQMVPQLADPVGWWFDFMKFKAGVDKNGDVGFVMTSFDVDAAVPPILLLIPVSDYAGFIGNFADAKKDGDLDVVHVEAGGNKDNQDTFIAHWGNYAVMTPNKALLAKKPDGLKVTGVAGKELQSRDVAWYLNVKTVAPLALNPLKQNRDKILGEMDKALTGNAQFNPKFAPVLKVTVTQFLAAAEEILTDTRAVTFGFNLSEDGIATSLTTEFDPDTYLGKAVGGMKNTEGTLLAGLPEGKYLMYGGSLNDSAAAGKLVDDFLGPIMKELEKTGDDGKPILDYTNAMVGMIKATKSSTMGLIAPTGALGATPLLQMVAIYAGDANALQVSQQKAMESEQALMALFQQAGAAGPKMDVKYTPNAKEVDGVKFNKFTSTFGGDNNSPEVLQMKQMMAMFYGAEGPSGYAGTIDDGHVLIYSGIDDAMVSAAIKSVKAGQDTLGGGEGLALVNKNLPKNRMGAFYVSVDTIFNTVANYAKMMGLPIPLNFKPNLPPLGLAVASEGSAIRFDGFIPSDVVQEIIATAIKYQMMQQGGKPGQPGGL